MVIKTDELKKFAYIWASIFIIIGLFPLIKDKQPIIISILASIFFIIVGMIKPLMLKSFYNIWIKIGDFIGNIVSKVIMFILYFGLFTPISFVLKILGKDLLNKTIDKSQKSYWVTRKTQPESMKNQF